MSQIKSWCNDGLNCPVSLKSLFSIQHHVLVKVLICLEQPWEINFKGFFSLFFNPAFHEYLRSILNQGKKKKKCWKAIDTLCIKDATSPDMTVIRQDEQSLSASPAVAGSASRPAIYNSKADKWRESGPLISVNWMWRHFFTAVRYDASPEDIRGGRCIGIFNVLIRGRVDGDRSCHASTFLSRRAGKVRARC